MDASVFQGCIPALMTPCDANGNPDWQTLVETARYLTSEGMHAVVYCGSMGEWPLLTDRQRQQGVEHLVSAGIRVIVGTGAQNLRLAVEHAAHAQQVGAHGLMVIPRVLSRGTSPAAQEQHFSDVLQAGPKLPAVIYNSPYYGFETKAELFFRLRHRFGNLVGFKEFGGAESLSHAAEHITSGGDDIILMAGVDTQVVHGFLRCGARGAITGIGNCLPRPVLTLVALCKAAAQGDVVARGLAIELDDALKVLSTFDEGPDLVLYYKALMVLAGHDRYEHTLHGSDRLSDSQYGFVKSQYRLFENWWRNWPGKCYCEEPASMLVEGYV